MKTTNSFPAGVGVRARLRLVKGDAIKWRINGNCELVLANWASYLSVEGGFVGNDKLRVMPGEWVEIMLVSEDGQAREWLNGVPLFDIPTAWPDSKEGSIGLGIEKGVFEVERWEVLEARN